MTVKYICIKELDYGIKGQVIHVGDIFTFIESHNDISTLSNGDDLLEIYDWALKEYFKEVV